MPSLVYEPTTVSTIHPSVIIEDDQVVEVGVTEDKFDQLASTQP